MKNPRFWFEWGHHYKDREIYTLKLMLLKHVAYDTEWGLVNILTFVDEYGQIFQHRTRKHFRVIVDNHYTIEGRIYHSEFRGRKTTYIKRPKFLKNES